MTLLLWSDSHKFLNARFFFYMNLVIFWLNVKVEKRHLLCRKRKMFR